MAFFDTGTNPFEGMNIFGARAPSYMDSLLDPAALDKLKQQSLVQGLLGTAATYLAQPKNQRYGSALPYLGKAFLGGMQQSQGVYDQATQDYIMKSKIAEMQKEQETEKTRQDVINKLAQTPEYQADPQRLAALKLAPKEMLLESIKSPDLPSSVKEYKYAQSQGYTGKYEDFVKEQKKAGATNVNVGGESFGKEFGKGVASNVQITYEGAQAAQNTIAKIQDIRPLIKEGVYSGPLSKQQQLITQIGTKLGVASPDATETLKRTAETMQGLAQFELNAAASMRGQGAITENERMLIQRAAGGRLENFTAPELDSLLNALEKTSKYKIKAHETNLERLKKTPEASQFSEYYKLPPMPEAPKAVAPATGRTRQDILKQYGF